MHRAQTPWIQSFPQPQIYGSAILVICTSQSILSVTFSQVMKMAEPGNSWPRYILLLLLITLSQATRMSEV
jgi:hypothetical protein